MNNLYLEDFFNFLTTEKRYSLHTINAYKRDLTFFFNYIKKENRWSESIMKNGKYIYLGYFKTEEEAKEARRQAEIKYFGEFRYKD